MTASAQVKQEGVNLSRREMLNYLFGASAALALVGSCGSVLLFAGRQVVHRYGSQTGYYLVDLNDLPTPSRPIFMADAANVWLVVLDEGLVAYSVRCPNCSFPVRLWADWLEGLMFRCGFCPSEFALDGTPIWGRTPRGLDRQPLQVTTDRLITTPDNGAPVPFEGARQIVVDANRAHRILGQPTTIRYKQR